MEEKKSLMPGLGFLEISPTRRGPPGFSGGLALRVSRGWRRLMERHLSCAFKAKMASTFVPRMHRQRHPSRLPAKCTHAQDHNCFLPCSLASPAAALPRLMFPFAKSNAFQKADRPICGCSRYIATHSYCASEQPWKPHGFRSEVPAKND